MIWLSVEEKHHQPVQLVQRRSKRRQPLVSYKVGREVQALERGQRPLGEGGGEGSGTLEPNLRAVEGEASERGQLTAAAEAGREQCDALVAMVAANDDQLSERRHQVAAGEGAQRPPVGEGEGPVDGDTQLQRRLRTQLFTGQAARRSECCSLLSVLHKTSGKPYQATEVDVALLAGNAPPLSRHQRVVSM